jgi:hypothetical protein
LEKLIDIFTSENATSSVTDCTFELAAGQNPNSNHRPLKVTARIDMATPVEKKFDDNAERF